MHWVLEERSGVSAAVAVGLDSEPQNRERQQTDDLPSHYGLVVLQKKIID